MILIYSIFTITEFLDFTCHNEFKTHYSKICMVHNSSEIKWPWIELLSCVWALSLSTASTSFPWSGHKKCFTWGKASHPKYEAYHKNKSQLNKLLKLSVHLGVPPTFITSEPTGSKLLQYVSKVGRIVVSQTSSLCNVHSFGLQFCQ